jgi:predicted nucleic acid-binding protein
VKFDKKLLPRRALFDTGVFIRSIRQARDENTLLCARLFEAMEENHSVVVVAAPSIAETLRFRGPTKGRVPQTETLEIAAFDDVAAEVLGEKLPMPVLDEVALTGSTSRTCLKFDTQIAASAKRWEVECIITLDPDFLLLAKKVEVPVKHPKDFLAKQMSLEDLTSTVGKVVPIKKERA